MASAHVTTGSILSSFLPRLSPPTASSTSRFTVLYSRQLSLPLLPSLGLTIPSAIQLNLPGLVEGLWESILRAVPKKKTSHMKKRHRQYAGKALKDVTALNKCAACGNIKRAHLLCPYCVNEIKGMFQKNAKAMYEAKSELTVLEKGFPNSRFRHVEKEKPEGRVKGQEKRLLSNGATPEPPSDASA